MRNTLLPLLLATGLVAAPAFALDLGSAVDAANAKSQAALNAAATAQSQADAKADSASAGLQAKASAVDAVAGTHTAANVSKANKHKHKADRSLTKAREKASDTKTALSGAASAAGLGNQSN